MFLPLQITMSADASAAADLSSRLALGRQRVCALAQQVHTALDEVRANAAAARDAVSAAMLGCSEELVRDGERLLTELDSCESRKLSRLEAEADAADAVLAQLDALLDGEAGTPPEPATSSLLDRIFRAELFVVEPPGIDFELDNTKSTCLGRVRSQRPLGPSDIALEFPFFLAMQRSLTFHVKWHPGEGRPLSVLLPRMRISIAVVSHEEVFLAPPTSDRALRTSLASDGESIVATMDVPELSALQACCADSDAEICVAVGLSQDVWSADLPPEVLEHKVRLVCRHEPVSPASVASAVPIEDDSKDKMETAAFTFRPRNLAKKIIASVSPPTVSSPGYRIAWTCVYCCVSAGRRDNSGYERFPQR